MLLTGTGTGTRTGLRIRLFRWFPRARLTWRTWRKGRPFWGGLLVILAGTEICYLPLAPLDVMLKQGVAGISSLFMGLILVLMGLALWFSPQHRVLAGVVCVLAALAALVLSNLGGFLLGSFLAIVGGGMGFGWQPFEAPRPATPADAP